MALYIGFTEKYYTLWDCYEQTVEDRYEKYTKWVNTYLQNLSMDLEAAKAKYPEAIVDLELRGHSSFDIVKKSEPINNNLFNYGKYEGREILECSDESYLEWFRNSCNEERKAYINKALVQNCGWIEHNGEVMSKEGYQEYLTITKKEKKILELVETKSDISFVMNSNVEVNYDDENHFGYYFVGWGENDEFFANICFRETQENYYAGYHYYLPVLKGKGKRVKGKKVTITDYDYEQLDNGHFLITVKNFKVEKVA